jgi:cell division protein FtsW
MDHAPSVARAAARATLFDRRRPDSVLLLVVGLLAAIGAVMVFSASSAVAYTAYHDPAYFLKRELLWLAVGGIALWLGLRMDYARLRGAAPWLFGIAVLLLAAVLLPHVGSMEGGARRWFSYRSFSFEPSELANIALIIFLAKLFADREDGARSFRRAGAPALFAVGLCFMLVMRQPDLGTASLFVATAFVMMFVAGARLRDLMVEFAVALPALAAFVFSSPYRRDRFTAFLHPWKDPQGTGYHIIQSLYALGSGGWFGVGLGESRQKFGYLPEQYTDFIFSIIGEELGYIGAAVVVGLFIALAYRGMRIATESDDRFGFYLATGITAWLVLQAFVNIGVASSSWPVTGVPLPFISYGGTALVASLFSVGVLAGVSRGRSRAALAAEAQTRGARAHSSRRRRHGRASLPRAVTSQSALRRAR